MIRLVVASKNPDKIAEMESVLGELGVEVVRGLEWDEIEETGDTLVENALLKARAVHRATGLAAVADDTGLEVDALSGRPGVHSARFAGDEATYEDNLRALLAALDGVEERSARFRAVVALVAGTEEIVAEGILEGKIITEPRGTGGFGYDPVFQLSDGRTLAELTDAEKNSISHRARAIRALASSVRFQSLVTGRARGVARLDHSE